MQQHFIVPGEKVHVNYWTKRWGITPDQLHSAIIETGSMRVDDLKQHFRKKIPFSVNKLISYMRLNFL